MSDTNTIDAPLLRELLAAEPAERPWRAGVVDADRVFCPFPEGLAGHVGERVVLRTNTHFPGRTAELVAGAVNALGPLLALYEAACRWADDPRFVADDELFAVIRAVREGRLP